MIVYEYVFLLTVLSITNGSDVFEESLIKEVFNEENMSLTISTCWKKGNTYLSSCFN